MYLFRQKEFSLYKQQITALTIEPITRTGDFSNNIDREIFTSVLSSFNNLEYLNFDSYLNHYQNPSSRISFPPVFSSNLFELCIKVRSFADCLYLLDGRFNQLRRFLVDLYSFGYSSSEINNEVQPHQCLVYILFSERKGYSG